MSFGHPNPESLIERAADAAFRAAEATLAEHGATLGLMYVALHGLGMPEGDLDAVTAATGDDLPDDEADRARAVLAFLVGEAVETGKLIGVTMHVAPLASWGEG